MPKIKHRQYDDAYKRGAVELVLSGDCSTSRYCYDNACRESFFHTLKTEEVYFNRYRTRAEARASIFEYIEGWYNIKRRHSTLGYKAPSQFELLKRAS
jgi:putative transposase